MANLHIVGEELGRTLSYLGHAGEDASPKRARKGFFVFTLDDPRSPLLYASAIELLAERLDIEEKARRWLSKPHRMLGAVPLQMLSTDAGAHEVEGELNCIEFGDFA